MKDIRVLLSYEPVMVIAVLVAAFVVVAGTALLDIDLGAVTGLAGAILAGGVGQRALVTPVSKLKG